jgi:hypothetical protein
MRLTLALAAALLGCVFAQAGEKTSEDLMGGVLQRCPKEDRRTFLDSLSFVDDKLVSFNYKSLEAGLAGTKEAAVSQRLARARPIGAQKEASPTGSLRLFAGCSKSVRQDFYDSLVFQGGGLASLKTAKVRKCASDWDLARFLSIFGPDGQDLRQLKDRCAFDDKKGGCISKKGHSCAPEACAEARTP